MHLQLEARKNGEKIIVSKGATVSQEPHEFGWRDAMDIVVKWRQFSEPNDQASSQIRVTVDLISSSAYHFPQQGCQIV